MSEPNVFVIPESELVDLLIKQYGLPNDSYIDHMGSDSITGRKHLVVNTEGKHE